MSRGRVAGRRSEGGGAIPLVVVLAMGMSIPAAARPVEGPVAVMPFKNLNEEAQLGWLSRGIAETLISDIRTTGALEVVERDQVNVALAELKLQLERGVQPASAVRLGKLVGAKTVVIGAYQHHLGQLRITARFVSVETGEILGTAKVTGHESTIFRLQDEIVARLLGRSVEEVQAARRKRTKAAWARRRARRRRARERAEAQKKRKEMEARRLEAFRLYAMSLDVQSDAARAALLQKAVAVDPDFVYALEDLDRLERRIDLLRMKSDQVLDARLAAQRKRLFELDPSTTTGYQEAVSVLSGHMQARTWGTLVEDVDLLLEKDWSRCPTPGVDCRAMLEHFRLIALKELRRFDEGIAAAESFLERHPGSQVFMAVEMLLDSMMREKRMRLEGRGDYEDEMVKVEKRIQRLEAEAERTGRPPDDARLAGFLVVRCSSAVGHHQFQTAVLECGEFIRRFKDNHSARRPVLMARFYLGRALMELGQFEAATKIFEELKEDDQAFAREWSVNVFLQTMPRGPAP